MSDLNEEKTQITISGVLNLLKGDGKTSGMTRPEIKAHYSLETWEMEELFSHPSLKGKKRTVVKERVASFVLIDDTVKNVAVLEDGTDLGNPELQEVENVEVQENAPGDEEKGTTWEN